MIVSCSYCGGLHKRGYICPKRPTNSRRPKEANYITRFRSSKAWQQKRNEIRTRDLQLCRNCQKNGKYVFNGLSVHHIRPIAKAWNSRLENSNLITLCAACHSMAEDGKISVNTLVEMAKEAKNADAF
jgi:5-methylcytosine-specific restriction endonuclease McrA